MVLVKHYKIYIMNISSIHFSLGLCTNISLNKEVSE